MILNYMTIQVIIKFLEVKLVGGGYWCWDCKEKMNIYKYQFYSYIAYGLDSFTKWVRSGNWFVMEF